MTVKTADRRRPRTLKTVVDPSARLLTFKERHTDCFSCKFIAFAPPPSPRVNSVIRRDRLQSTRSSLVAQPTGTRKNLDGRVARPVGQFEVHRRMSDHVRPDQHLGSVRWLGPIAFDHG